MAKDSKPLLPANDSAAAYCIGEDQVRGSMQCGISIRRRSFATVPRAHDVRFSPEAEIGGTAQRRPSLLCPLPSGIAAAVIEDRHMATRVEIFNRPHHAIKLWTLLFS